jgi:hypothetical protein
MAWVMRRLREALIVPLFGAVVAMAGEARAHGPGDGCRPGWRGGQCDRTVIVCETVKVPCIRSVTRFDDCGRPYRVRCLSYRYERVPVRVRAPIPDREQPSEEQEPAGGLEYASR